MRRGSSRRLMRSPTNFGAAAWLVTTSCRGHPLGGVLNRIDDVLYPVQRQRLPEDALADLVLSGSRVICEQPGSGHDHPRGAVAALQAVLFPEPDL